MIYNNITSKHNNIHKKTGIYIANNFDVFISIFSIAFFFIIATFISEYIAESLIFKPKMTII